MINDRNERCLNNFRLKIYYQNIDMEFKEVSCGGGGVYCLWLSMSDE